MKMNLLRLAGTIFAFSFFIFGLSFAGMLENSKVVARTDDSLSPILLQPADDANGEKAVDDPPSSPKKKRTSRTKKESDENLDQETNQNDDNHFDAPQDAPNHFGPPERNDFDAPNEEGRPGFNRHRRREEEKIVPLPEALEKAGPTDPIPLNQRDLFITADQVQLRGIYYKGAADNATVPVILIHDKSGKKEDWEPIAKQLAEKGMAVLIPDLRGHGESVTAAIEDFSPGGDRPAIRQNEYRAESFNDSDLDGMRSYDGLLWFQFLVWLHNEEKINIRKLVLIGNGFGAGIGASWIFNDWKATSPKKGRFTKTFVLISPDADSAFEKIGSSRAKADNVHYKIFVGDLEKTKFKNAEEIRLQLAKEKESTPEEERKVPIESFKTEKQGVELMEVESFQISDKIIQFIEENSPSSTSDKWQPIKHFMENN